MFKYKKSFNISKGLKKSKAVNRRRTDNAMAKRKKDKGTNNHLKTPHRKLRSRKMNATKNRACTRVLRSG